MNQNVIRMFSRKKAKESHNKERHLWSILKRLSASQHRFKESPSDVGDIAIEFAPDGQRARKVVSRANYRMTGKQPSRKNDRMVQWESEYEKKAFLLLEISPHVKSYREQPATFIYDDQDGSERKHYPDIYVELNNGVRLFIEVKPGRAQDDQELLIREALLKKLLAKQGYNYIQIYPEQVESLSYQENAQNMVWHQPLVTPYPIQHKVLALINLKKQVSFQELMQEIRHEKAKSWLFHMLIVGLIECDLSTPLQNETKFSIRGGY